MVEFADVSSSWVMLPLECMCFAFCHHEFPGEIASFSHLAFSCLVILFSGASSSKDLSYLRAIRRKIWWNVPNLSLTILQLTFCISYSVRKSTAIVQNYFSEIFTEVASGIFSELVFASPHGDLQLLFILFFLWKFGLVLGRDMLHSEI